MCLIKFLVAKNKICVIEYFIKHIIIKDTAKSD